MAEELGRALIGLTNSIRSTMANVHNLNLAVLNTRTHYSMHNQFTNLRNTLKTHWDNDLTKLLQQIHQVVGGLIFLGKSVGKESEQECCVLLQETIHSITAIEISCRTCVARNAEITRNVQTASSQFANLAHQLSFDVYVRPASPLSSESSSEDDTFVRSSLMAAYPDLSSSAASTLSSLTDTQNHLTAILHFVVGLRKAGESMLEASFTQNHRVSEVIHQMYLTSWETNRQDLHTTFLELAPIIDAITVEPSLNWHQRRQGRGFPSYLTSTIAKPSRNVCYPSATSSATLSPTRVENNEPSRQSSFMNVQDSAQYLAANVHEKSEDLVPLSCWKGIFFGHTSTKKRSDYPTVSNHTH